MTEKPTHTQAGGSSEKDELADEIVVNDSMGTIDIADSTGVEVEKETGDAKDKNKNTKED